VTSFPLHPHPASFDTRLGFAVALLRMRQVVSWRKRHCLILSASEASSRRTQATRSSFLGQLQWTWTAS